MFVGRVVSKSRVGHRRFSSLSVLPLSLLANAVPFTLESRPRCVRACSQMRSCLVPDSFVPRPRFVRAWEQMRVRLAPRALTNIGSVFPCRQDRQANLAQKTGGPCAKAGKMRWRERRRLWGIVRRDDDFSVSFSLVSRYRRTAAIPARSWA